MSPSVSPEQHAAMEAAAHGNSSLGIPASVGAEFVAADKNEKKVHPFRRRKRGKRGGKKHKNVSRATSEPLALASDKPSTVPNLRKRLQLLAKKGDAKP